MKETFQRLSPEKRQRILAASIEEFGQRGYSGGSTDRICRRSGISKGGLYEYIDAKEELFLRATEEVYGQLYSFISASLSQSPGGPPKDPLDRFFLVAEIAIDFYISHPDYIALIQQTNILGPGPLRERSRDIFMTSFQVVFGDLDGAGLRFPIQRVRELLIWLLLKTRNDFLAGLSTSGPAELRRAYLDEWGFYLDALRSGIYDAPTMGAVDP